MQTAYSLTSVLSQGIHGKVSMLLHKDASAVPQVRGDTQDSCLMTVMFREVVGRSNSFPHACMQ